MKTQNKNIASEIVQNVAANLGFLAMTAASLLILAPELPEARPHDSGGAKEHAAGQVHANHHERMEEIRHDPHIYGSIMRSPSTAGSQ